MKKTLYTLLAMPLCFGLLASCSGNKWKIKGEIASAKDSILYLDYFGLDGAKAIDSIKLDNKGTFSFSEKAVSNPEFYRLRINEQFINFAVDSTETITIKASYPTMSTSYEISGSQGSETIKELVLAQIALQKKINEIIADQSLSLRAENESIDRVVTRYKEHVKKEYIYKAPMRSYSYYALFQTINTGNNSVLLFNPRNSKEDIKAFAAIATSWDTYYPNSERGENLHNIALEGMKNVRIIENRNREIALDASKVNVSGLIDIALPDNKGRIRKLSELKGKVVLLDFQIFSDEQSLKRTMMLRELYNKYHKSGFEIYQVSVDPQEHYWKTKTSALPWISVWDENGINSSVLGQYNVRTLPTFFLINRDNVLQKRDAQIQDLDAEIVRLLR